MSDVMVDPTLLLALQRLKGKTADLEKRLAALPAGMIPEDPAERAVLAKAAEQFQGEAAVPGLDGLLDALRRPYRWRVAKPIAGWGGLESESGFGGKQEFDSLAQAMSDARQRAQTSDLEFYSATTGWSWRTTV